MIQTYRCGRCGQVLEAFVEFAPGIALAVSQTAMESRIRASRNRHAERCPGPKAKMRPERSVPAAKPRPTGARKLALPVVWRRRETG